MVSDCTVAVFAKAPVAGQVKTRLAAVCGAEYAARFAEACLADLLDRLAAAEAQRLLAFTPDTAKEYFAALARERYELVPQSEGDLGRRLERFLAPRLAGGGS